MRSRFVHQAPPGASVTFGMSQAISEKLPVYVESRGDVQHQNPMTVPPSGQIVCYLDAEKAYDVKIVGLDGTIQILEDPAVEPVAVNLDPLKKDIEALKNRKPEQAECRCRALEFDQLKKAQDVLSQQVKTLLTTPRSNTPAMSPREDQRVDQLITRNRELEETVKALTSRFDDLVERVDALDRREVETDGITFTQEFLKEQQLPEEIDLAATAQRLGAEFNNLLNAMQDYPTEDEKSRFQEMTANKLD